MRPARRETGWRARVDSDRKFISRQNAPRLRYPLEFETPCFLSPLSKTMKTLSIPKCARCWSFYSTNYASKFEHILSKVVADSIEKRVKRQRDASASAWHAAEKAARISSRRSLESRLGPFRGIALLLLLLVIDAIHSLASARTWAVASRRPRASFPSNFAADYSSLVRGRPPFRPAFEFQLEPEPEPEPVHSRNSFLFALGSRSVDFERSNVRVEIGLHSCGEQAIFVAIRRRPAHLPAIAAGRGRETMLPPSPPYRRDCQVASIVDCRSATAVRSSVRIRGQVKCFRTKLAPPMSNVFHSSREFLEIKSSVVAN
ncbi:hypothetical protein V9T40_009850 [Parthenolecanium corni]|uniref:Uncharacterized protein n=1 Tax=Parthenolecanium corni TaxID=536013 RepID=A0AAN9TL52_9HEMI